MYPEILSKSKQYIINFRNSFFYLGGTIIGLLISLYTFPIYSKYLTSADFGVIGFYSSIQLFFTPLSVLSLTNYYLMAFFKNDEHENKIILFNLLFFLAISNISLIAIAHLIIFAYFHFTFVTIPFFPYVTIVLFTIFFNVVYTFTLVHLRVKRQAYRFFFIAVCTSILNALFSIVFIKYFALGVTGRLGGILCSYIFISILCLLFLRKDLIWEISFVRFKTALKKISPMIISSYACIPTYSIDNIYLEKLKMLDEQGLYNIGKQIAGFFKAAGVSLFQAFEPDIYKQLHLSNIKKVVSTFIVFTSVLILGLILFLFIVKPLIGFLTINKYLGALQYTKLIVLGAFLSPIIQSFGVILLSNEKVRQNAFIDIVGGISSIILYGIFIFFWGFKGAALAQIGVPLAMLITVVLLIKRNNLWKSSH